VSYIDDGMRSTKVRSVRTVVGLFLMKMKTALGNAIMGTLFQMTKFQVFNLWDSDGLVLQVSCWSSDGWRMRTHNGLDLVPGI